MRRWCRLVDDAASARSESGAPGVPPRPTCACSCRRPGTRTAVAGEGSVRRRAPGRGRALPGAGRPGAGRGWRASWSAPASRWCSPAVPTSAPSSGGVASAAGLPPERCTAGELTLPELSALVAGAALLVCGDTGVAHLGTALGTPSVIVFGPVPPTRWGPLADPERHTVIWHGAGLGEGDGNADRCDPGAAARARRRGAGRRPGTVGSRSRGYGGVMTEPFPPEPLPSPPSPAPPEPPSSAHADAVAGPTAPGPGHPRPGVARPGARPARSPASPDLAPPPSDGVGLVLLLTGSRRSGESLAPERGS